MTPPGYSIFSPPLKNRAPPLFYRYFQGVMRSSPLAFFPETFFFFFGRGELERQAPSLYRNFFPFFFLSFPNWRKGGGLSFFRRGEPGWRRSPPRTRPHFPFRNAIETRRSGPACLFFLLEMASLPPFLEDSLTTPFRDTRKPSLPLFRTSLFFLFFSDGRRAPSTTLISDLPPFPQEEINSPLSGLIEEEQRVLSFQRIFSFFPFS